MTARRILRPLLVAAAVLLAAWTGLNAVLDHQPAPNSLAGHVRASAGAAPAAPELVLETIGGETFRLSDQRGKVVVLNFWATWCAPCRYEIPDFIALQDDFGTDDVVFVGVSVEQGNPRGVAQFAEELGIPYPIAVDDGSAKAAYGPILSLPTTFLIDRAGAVRGHVPGLVPRALLEPALDVLVAE